MLNFDNVNSMYNSRELLARPTTISRETEAKIKAATPPKPSTLNKVLDEVKAFPGIDRVRLKRRTGLGYPSLRKAIDTLLEQRKISRTPYGKSGNNTLYFYFEFGKSTKTLTNVEAAEKKVLALLTKKSMTNKELVKASKLTKYRVKKALISLREKGQVNTVEQRSASGHFEYFHEIKGE